MPQKIRIAAGIEYGGARYSGWQFQSNADSVQARVEDALSRVADSPVRVIAAGRTDTGVHAGGQVIHFDTDRARDNHAWLRGANTHLPDDISVLWVQPVADDFHARFAATERAYRYVIFNRAVRPAYLHDRVTWHYAPLIVAPMQRAAQALVGRHDFSAFRAAGCQSKQPCKDIRELTLQQHGEWIWLDIRADGFLHHMVRNIAGTLIKIGEGHAPEEWAAQLLASCDRTQGGMTAAAAGLYFVGVTYPSRFAIPSPPAPCRFW